MLPKVIRVLGKPYKVEYSDSITEFGLCDESKQTIKIQKGMPPELEGDTLLHEAIHAIDFGMHTELTEKQVSALGSGLWAILNDNPELVRYLTAKLKRR